MCVGSPQTLEIPPSLFFPAVFHIFIFILLYLITAIPLSISFISSSTHPSIQAFKSHLSLFTSCIRSNSSSCFNLRKPPNMDVLFPFRQFSCLCPQISVFSHGPSRRINYLLVSFKDTEWCRALHISIGRLQQIILWWWCPVVCFQRETIYFLNLSR